MREVVAILHNIRSIHNVASMFRTADGAGLSALYLTGITPGPIDRFERPVQQFVKVSLGAEQTVPWQKQVSIATVIKKLKKAGFTIIAIEQAENSKLYTSKLRTKKIAFVMGSEPDGLPPGVLKQCDMVFEIPMRGAKESLNVSVAFGLIAYQLV